jgi:teichuronic acid biosynthesis glycosyltransferase TuaH
MGAFVERSAYSTALDDESAPAPGQPTRNVLVYLAGTEWDGVEGTDRRLVLELAKALPVLWVDPPQSAAKQRWWGVGAKPQEKVDVVADGICRLRVFTVPGTTRAVLRSIAAAQVRSHLRRVIGQSGHRVAMVVLASPEARFPRGARTSRRLLYLTDDWSAGASMMGLSRSRTERLTRLNAARADVVAAVSPDLLSKVGQAARSSADLLLLPNGCNPDLFTNPDQPGERDLAVLAQLPDRPFAILVGQLNERLDLTAVLGVAQEGVPVVVVGPRTERSAATTVELDALLAHPNVTWLGRQDPGLLPVLIRAAAVGLTPYVDNEFNRASFPLKTLEYLAGGIAVVATDLPSARWLNSDLVTIVHSRNGMASAVKELVSSYPSADVRLVERRQAVARQHSWGVRSEALLARL